MGTSCQSTENAKVVSCDNGENGFEVDGSGWAEELLGMGTASTSGAVCGELLAREFGKTSVSRAKCSTDYGSFSMASETFRIPLTESTSAAEPRNSLCHFQPVSWPTLRLRAPSTSQVISIPLEEPDLFLPGSKRLPSRSPI